MAPPPIFITVNLHSLLTLRTGPMQLGTGHPHLDLPLLGLEGYALHLPRGYQPQNLLIELKVFQALEVASALAARQWSNTGRAQRSGARTGAKRFAQRPTNPPGLSQCSPLLVFFLNASFYSLPFPQTSQLKITRQFPKSHLFKQQCLHF